MQNKINSTEHSSDYAVKQRQYSNLSHEIENGIRYESVITVRAQAKDIYSFWKNIRNLPRFMKHLSAVQVTGPETSHWKWSVLKGNAEVEWDSEIVRTVPDALIAWRSREGSIVAHTGEVSFQELPFNRGTEVRVILNYHPPGGAVTDFVGKILGESPGKEILEDLHRLRSLMEVGEIITTEGQPRGGMDETLNPKFYRHH